MAQEEAHGIVIVGGGICGLATALALHRKGISCTVLERSERLRSTGAAIGMWANGWRVLDQLQVGTELREKANLLNEMLDRSVQNGETSTTRIRGGLRCLKRKDLVETLAAKLPPGTVHLDRQIDGITLDAATSYPVLSSSDGKTIRAKILIGCDGSNSVVARFLGLRNPTPVHLWVVRGFTSYPDGHGFGDNFLRCRGKGSFFGRLTITDTLVHFFIRIPAPSIDASVRNDHALIRKLAIEKAQEFAPDIIDLVERCDLESLSLTQVRHRVPWHLSKGKFHRSTVTVAGDALHVVSPFLGQGGALGLEDTIVLCRHIALAIPGGLDGGVGDDGTLVERMGAAYRAYAEERWPRLVRMSTRSFIASSASTSTSIVVKLFCFAMVVLIFGGVNNFSHVDYDCGKL